MLQTQLIFCGDNLQKLRELPDECVDLVYIDPPFNMKRAGGACARRPYCLTKLARSGPVPQDGVNAGQFVGAEREVVLGGDVLF